MHKSMAATFNEKIIGRSGPTVSTAAHEQTCRRADRARKTTLCIPSGYATVYAGTVILKPYKTMYRKTLSENQLGQSLPIYQWDHGKMEMC